MCGQDLRTRNLYTCRTKPRDGNFTEIPPGLPQNVEEILIYESNLQIIRNKDFYKLHACKILIVTYSSLSNVEPLSFRGLRHLTELRLSHRWDSVTFTSPFALTLSLPPANEVWVKIMFLHLSVILFTGGVSQHAMVRWCLPLDLGGVYHPVQTPLVGRHHPRQIPTVGRLSPVEMTIEAGGTHPTGMHSFLLLIRCEEKFFLSMEWNSIKLGGSAHEIVTKTIHMCILH